MRPARAAPSGGEWQCASHCHSEVNAPYWHAQGASGSAGGAGGALGGRVAVHLTLPLGGERTEQRIPHCHSMSSVPRRYAQGRVAVRPSILEVPGEVLRKAPGEALSFRLMTKAGLASCEACLLWIKRHPSGAVTPSIARQYRPYAAGAVPTLLPSGAASE